jgi:hypothetical protein
MLIRQGCRWFVHVDWLQDQLLVDYMRQVVVELT